ncbi:hypothetical protein L0244_30775, partial [bacterium]|nr:hypothetical protein [bacterium]
HVHHDFARRATALINGHIAHLTNGHWSSAKLDAADFSLQLQAKQEEKLLSKAGAIDPAVHRNIFLLLRLSMPALMADGRETIPVFVETSEGDEELSQRANTGRVLESVGKQHQVLIFTGDKKNVFSLQQKPGILKERKLAGKT